MRPVPPSNNPTRERTRSVLAVAATLTLAMVAGCSQNLPPATIPASGITASTGGGMRQTGAIPDVTITNGNAAVGTMPRNPRVPTY